ncbi:MAG: hypothetical protein HUU46_04900 [Candidatus Hydrogenedentes bacterium]|nr:hypothetical protein [Candidatus Hydrogenedentota bacterium]
MSVKRALCVLALNVFALPAFAGTNDGAGEARERITLWHQFYLDRGVDYTRFGELGATRTAFRRMFVQEIAALQELGAKPIDAAVVLLALDRHYNETIARAERGIEASFAAEFRTALLSHYERTGNPQRIVMFDGTFVPKNAKSEDASSAPIGVDMVASGTWSNVDGYTVRVSMDFVFIGTGSLISFTAEGTVPEAAEGIAFQLFDYFEKNRFPEPENPLAHLEVRPALPGHSIYRGVPRDAAVRACEGQGFRLPYSYELDLIFAQGPYEDGGIEIDPNWYYHVADDAEHVWLAPGKLENVHGLSLANFEKRSPYYIMVKGSPSANVQLITKLTHFMKSESRRPKSDRDTLAIYAARLALADLGAKTPDSERALELMKREFRKRDGNPWVYLREKGITRTSLAAASTSH